MSGTEKPLNRFINTVAESFASTWQLLSDTNNYLSRVGLLPHYEQDLKGLRERLARFARSADVVHQVREDVVRLRRDLRQQGHDLRLGSKDIKLEGYRHDDAMAEGFRRLVLCITESEIYYLAGEANHGMLADLLSKRLEHTRHNTYDVHYLWYAWRNQVLVLSGSASETKQQFERLKGWFEGNRELLLRKLARV